MGHCNQYGLRFDSGISFPICVHNIAKHTAYLPVKTEWVICVPFAVEVSALIASDTIF